MTAKAVRHLCPFNRSKPVVEGSERGRHWHTTSSALGFFHIVQSPSPEPEVVLHVMVSSHSDGTRTSRVVDMRMNLREGWCDSDRLARIIDKVLEEGTMVTRKRLEE